MRYVWMFVLLLFLAACGERVRPSASPPEPVPSATEGQTTAPAPTPDAPEQGTADPDPVPQEAESGFKVDSKRKIVPGAYSRELKVLYIEQRFRWQARALNEALKRDQGLGYQGFFFDAQDGWTQPTSTWSNEVARRGKPLRRPFYADGEEIREKEDFLAIGYDVVILGDIAADSKFWRAEYWDWLEAHVKQGGGLILLAGQANNPASYVDSEVFQRLCPVDVEVPPESPNTVNRGELKFWALTAEGREHEIFRLAQEEERNTELWGAEKDGKYTPGELHGLYWHAITGPAEEGATVLARAATSGESGAEGQVLAAVKELGQGRVLWIGTEDCHYWREYVGDYYFYHFWQNSIRWAANDPGKTN